MKFVPCIILSLASQSFAFSVSSNRSRHVSPSCRAAEQNEWNGEIVTNVDGRIRGCSLTRVEGSLTEWVISIDGIEADLSRFSEAIFKKITSDAKKQRFQGFRPGTIPPHLMPTYISFTMDECARETTLEAMQQNNIRPFDDARANFEFSQITIEAPKNKSKKKKKKSSTDGNLSFDDPDDTRWLVFDTMKEAIAGGWKPGESFSFVASNVKGQQLSNQDTTSANPIGGGKSIIS